MSTRVYNDSMTTTRKNRRTGSTVSMYHDDFLGWVTICETHGGYAEHATRRAAAEWIADPVVWCEGCAEVAA